MARPAGAAPALPAVAARLAPRASPAAERRRDRPQMALPPPNHDSTALITGASSGIGAEIARELARRGLGVTLVARREERLQELAGEIREDFGVETEVVAGDVANERARRRLFNEIEQRGLTVEVLVNNAGFGSGGRFTTLDASKEASMVRT